MKQLYESNPGGVIAPGVFIEGSDTEAFHLDSCQRSSCSHDDNKTRAKKFYDRSGAHTASASSVFSKKWAPSTFQYVACNRGTLACAGFIASHNKMSHDKVGDRPPVPDSPVPDSPAVPHFTHFREESRADPMTAARWV